MPRSRLLLTLLPFAAALAPTGALPQALACLDHGGSAICTQPEPTPWQIGVTEDFCADYGHWRRAGCICFQRGVWHGVYIGCLNGQPHGEEMFVPGAQCFEREACGACQVTASPQGWAPVGALFPSGMACGTGARVRARNGMPIDGFNVIHTEGHLWDGLECDIPYSRDLLVAVRSRSLVCPSGYRERSAANGDVECYREPKEDRCSSAGNPVQPAGGVKISTEIDYRGRGAFPLALERHYSNAASFWPMGGGEPERYGFGRNWRHTYDRRLFRLTGSSSASAVAARGDNEIKYFDLAGVEIGGCENSFDRIEPSGEGYLYRSSRGDEVEQYDGSGLLVSITNRAGLVQRLTYSDASTPPTIAPRPGLLLQVRDPFGRALELRYDAEGRIATLIDPAGNTTSYAYDAVSNLAAVTWPDGAVRTYHYNETQYTSGAARPHALTGITDENGSRHAIYRYDAGGFAVGTELAGGAQRYQVAFASDGTSIVTDPLGEQRQFYFQTTRAMLRPARIVGAPCDWCGAGAEQTYDQHGNLRTRTDWKGAITEWDYDPQRHLESRRVEGKGRAEERVVSTEWHPAFRLPVLQAEPLRLTTWSYDLDGSRCGARGAWCERTEQATGDPTGALGFAAAPIGSARTWRFTYNDAGLVLSEDGPRPGPSDTTTFSWDQDNLAAVTNALGHSVRFPAYDAAGYPLEIHSPNGLVTRLGYDARRRLVSMREGEELTTFAYDRAGQPVKVTLPDRSFVGLEYDAAHRLIALEDTVGNRTTFTLDAMGNRLRDEVRDPGGALALLVQRVFDASGRIRQLVGAENQATTYGTDGAGNVITVTDALARAFAFTYDAHEWVSESRDPRGGVAANSWDGLDQLVRVTDPRSLATTYTIDGLGNGARVDSPDRGQTDLEFDPAGNLVRAVDARGAAATFSWDAENRPRRLRATGGGTSTIIDWAYDQGAHGLGELTEIRLFEVGGQPIVTGYAHDPHGRVTRKTQRINNRSLAVGYRYDPLTGQMTGLDLPSGRRIDYRYDADGRVESLWLDGAALVSSVKYAAFGPVAGFAFWQGEAWERTYDRDGRVVSFRLGPELQTLRYDPAGRIVEHGDSAGGLRTYGYDELSRLVTAQGPAGNAAFAYDPTGNRITLTASGTPYAQQIDPASNRQIATAGPGLAGAILSDPTGNVVSAPRFAAHYDSRGRLRLLATPNSNVAYDLDGLGRRVRKTGPRHLVPGEQVIFVHDEAGRLLGEYDFRGVPLQEFVYLDDLPVVMLRGPRAATEPFAIFTDHQGTPRLLSDAQQRARWRWESLPFGESPAQEDPSGAGRVVFNLRFPGQYFDRESGLHQNTYRDYDPASGRYLQPDPIGLAGGLGTYTYVDNQPVALTDPTGEAVWFVAGAALDLALQLYLNDGDWSCVDWAQVALYGLGGGFLRATQARAFLFKTGSSKYNSNWRRWYRGNVQTYNGATHHAHHWLFEQNQGIGRYVAPWIKNQPWNISVIPKSQNLKLASRPAHAWTAGPVWAAEVAGGTTATLGATAVDPRPCRCQH